MQKLLITLGIIAMLGIFCGCSDSNDNSTVQKGSVSIEFDVRAGDQNFQLGTTYQNALGQDFQIDVFRYYISNIKLVREDGSTYEDPLSSDGSKGYYLIDEADQSSTMIMLEGVPFDEYTGMEFTIGVDADRVSQGAQTGALDPANNLFWSWNAGYIFVQIEGTSPESMETDNEIMYHIGGYKTDVENPNLANNIKIKSVAFAGETAHVTATSQPEIHIVVDVKKFFEGTTDTDFATNAMCHSPSCGGSIADNYESTFEFDHLHE